jgi:signal transduction histidine kinase
MRGERAPRAAILDAALAAAVVALGVVEVLTGGVQGPVPAALAAALLFGAPLVARRRAPWAVFAVVFGAFVLARVLGVSLDGFLSSVLGGVAALYSLVVRTRFGLSVPVFLVAYAVTLTTALRRDPGDLLWGLVIIGGTWLAAVEIRHRRDVARRLQVVTAELEASREEQAAAAVLVERATIARELHDVVAHALGVIVVQAGAASRVLRSDPPAAAGALDAIQDTGREALGDLRRMLDVLHDSGDAEDRSPQPGLADLDALVQRMRSTGLAVTVEREGDIRAVPAGLDLAAFRVVQEALTNVLKHARARSVDVAIRFGQDRLEIEVQDDGHGAPAPPASRGRGLEGMRARSALYGGSVSATATEAGYRVTASFPMGSAG